METRECARCKKVKPCWYLMCLDCIEKLKTIFGEWNTSDQMIELGDPETAGNYY